MPEYGSGALGDVMPAAVAGLAVPGMPAAIPELAPADRDCVFLVDGLGWELIKGHPDEAPVSDLAAAAPRSAAPAGR